MVNNNPSGLHRIFTCRGISTPRKILGLLTLLLLALALSGCVTLADPETSQDFTSQVIGVLDPETSIGQTFISRRPGLNGITIWLTLTSSQSNTATPFLANSISVQLFKSPADSTAIYSTSINAPISGNNVAISIKLPTQAGSGNQSFFILLKGSSGSFQVHGRNEDAYPSGQAYVNGAPINADLAFSTSYDYGFSSFGQDILHFLQNAWLAVPLLILLWLPGWLLLDFSGFRQNFDFGSQVGIAIGLSLALVPLLMVWTTTLHIPWSRDAVLFVAGFLLVIFLVRLIYRFVTSRKTQPDRSGNGGDIHKSWQVIVKKYIFSSSLGLILVFLGTLAVRLIMVRDLATPAWVDAIHHALITRLILLTGTYPATYQPYLNISSTVYHPGFHSIAASFVWLTNLDLPKALLILGQVLNALSVFTVYLFTKTLTRSAPAGLFAAIITGFLTPMPAYYTSWSRYTELTGVLILPVVLALAIAWLNRSDRKSTIWLLILGAITTGGLFMVHYRVIAFQVALLIALLITLFLFRPYPGSQKPARLLSLIVGMGLLSILIVLPWFIPALKSTFIPKVGSSVGTATGFFQDFPLPYLTSALGKQAMALAGLGFIWSITKERKLALISILWLLFLFFLANLDALKLPGGGLITNSSVEIILFIPISILGGYFFDQLMLSWKSILPGLVKLPAYAVMIILLGYVSYLGARQLVGIVNPGTILSRQADLPAIRWIDENIPKNETIVINPFSWGYGLFAGNDGGYWISPLSGNSTLPPPVLYGLGTGVKDISQQCQEISSLTAEPAALWQYLISHQYRYVFTGARGGVISPEKLASSDLFTVLYHQAGVWIFSAKP